MSEMRIIMAPVRRGTTGRRTLRTVVVTAGDNVEHHCESKQRLGGLQTAFGSSFDAAASGDRAISMESIRELAKRTVQKPINDGLLKVGDSQFMEKFRQRAAASASHGTDASAAFTGGLRRSASKPDDLNTDANKTTGAPSSSRRMRRSESKSGEDENTRV